MADTNDRAHDERSSAAKRNAHEQNEHQGHDHDTTPAHETAPSYPASLLGDPKLSGRGNGPVQIALMREMQQTYGNRAVQRFLQRAASLRSEAQQGTEAGLARPANPEGTTTVQRAQHKATMEEEDPLKKSRIHSEVVQRETKYRRIEAVQRNGTKTGKAAKPIPPAGTPWVKGKSAPITWELTQPAPKRSNSDSSLTTPHTPTFTGGPAVDAKGGVWRYQINSVESKGTIQIVFYTADHYPAPTPEDDSGPLTNVTKDNWKAIVKDLKKNRTGIADAWSAYRAENLHEDYHWEVEWEGKARPAIRKAEKEIAKLKVDFATAPTATDADTQLAPLARDAFTDAIKAGRKAFDKLGDSPGDPPYKAQAPAIDALIKRVNDYAKAQKW